MEEQLQDQAGKATSEEKKHHEAIGSGQRMIEVNRELTQTRWPRRSTPALANV